VSFRDYVDERYTIRDLATGQAQLIGACPFCGKEKSDLRLYMHFGRGLGYCHHCSQGFSAASFIAASEGCTYSKALEILAGDDTSDPYIRHEERKKIDSRGIYWPLIEPIIGTVGWEYMAGRGMGTDVIDHFNLMYCPADTVVEDESYDTITYYTGHRIFIPIYDHEGCLASWQGRDVTGRGIPKYLFPPGYKGAESLYNIHNIPSKASYVIISEGVFDVWGWWRGGFKNAVGTFGKKISTDQVEMIKAKNPGAVFIAWDADAKKEIYDFVRAYRHCFEIRIVDMGGKDADELKRKGLRDLIRTSQPYNWSAHVLDLINRRNLDYL